MDIRTAIVVLSNIFYLFPSYESLKDRDYVAAFVFALVTFASSLHHACQGWNPLIPVPTQCFGVSSTELAFFDNYTATLVLSLRFLYLGHWVRASLIRQGKTITHQRGTPAWIRDVCIMYYMVVLVRATALGFVTSLATHISFAISTLLLVFITHVRGKGYAHFDTYEMSIALVLGGIAIISFVAEDRFPPLWQWAVHTVWHVLGALAQVHVTRSQSDALTSEPQGSVTDALWVPAVH